MNQQGEQRNSPAHPSFPCKYSLSTGMSSQDFGIPSSIMLFTTRRGYAGMSTIAGMEHQCVHEVDRKNYPVIYWNAPYIAAASKNFRSNDYWTPLAADSGWKFVNRLGWYLAYVDYMKDGFGIVHPEKLNGFNPYSQEIRGDARFAFYKRRSWVVTVHEQFRFGHYDKTANVVDHGGLYWREDIGLENYFRKGKRGAAFYCKYIMDDLPSIKGLAGETLPVFSKDKLLEIGVSFFD